MIRQTSGPLSDFFTPRANLTYEVIPCVGPCGIRGDGPACPYCDHNVAVNIVNRSTARRDLAAEGITPCAP